MSDVINCSRHGQSYPHPIHGNCPACFNESVHSEQATSFPPITRISYLCGYQTDNGKPSWVCANQTVTGPKIHPLPESFIRMEVTLSEKTIQDLERVIDRLRPTWEGGRL